MKEKISFLLLLVLISVTFIDVESWKNKKNKDPLGIKRTKGGRGQPQIRINEDDKGKRTDWVNYGNGKKVKITEADGTQYKIDENGKVKQKKKKNGMNKELKKLQKYGDQQVNVQHGRNDREVIVHTDPKLCDKRVVVRGGQKKVFVSEDGNTKLVDNNKKNGQKKMGCNKQGNGQNKKDCKKQEQKEPCPEPDAIVQVYDNSKKPGFMRRFANRVTGNRDKNKIPELTVAVSNNPGPNNKNRNGGNGQNNNNGNGGNGPNNKNRNGGNGQNNNNNNGGNGRNNNNKNRGNAGPPLDAPPSYDEATRDQKFY